MFTDEQEVDLGDALAESIAQQVRVIGDDEVTAHLRNIGKRLLDQLPATKMGFRFYLVDLREMNAFGIAGGRIYVSRKLIAYAQNEDELAGVLAHEMGHILTHQSAVEFTRQLHEIGVREVHDRSDIYQRVHQLIDSRRKQKGRTLEAEHGQYIADQVALYAMARAGYAPHAFVDLWDRFEQTHGKTGTWFSDLLGSTKPEEKRLREMVKSMSALPAACASVAPKAAEAEFVTWQADVLAYAIGNRPESIPGLLQKVAINPPLRQDLRLLRFSPDGKRLLAQDDSGIFVMTREPFGPDFYIPAPGANRVRFSPDSESVVFSNSDLRIEKWSLQQKKRTWVRDVAVREGCAQTQISPDGNTLACVNWNFDLSLMDVASGVTWWSKKNFAPPSLFDFERILFQAMINKNNLQLLGMEFSPDGKYFLAGHRDARVIMDVAARREVNLPGRIHSLLANQFAFVGADKIVGRDMGSTKAQLVRFPTGEKIDSFEVGGSQLTQTTHGNYVLLHPLRDNPIGVFDFSKKEVVFSNRKLMALDVFDGVAVSERLNGEVGLYKLDQSTPIATTTLPQSPLGPLASVAISSDQRFLAVSGSTRGAVWDLSRNARISHLRSFHNAWFADDGSMYAEFPKFDKIERAIARTDLRTGDTDTKLELAEKNAKQYAGFVVFSSRKNDSRSTAGNGDLEFQDVRSGTKLWSRHFDREFPNWMVSPWSETAALTWTLSSHGAKDELQRFPNLHPHSGKDGLLTELVNARTGKDLGALVVSSGGGTVLYAGIDGDWVGFMLPGRSAYSGRSIICSLATGEEKLRIFGSNPRISAAAGLLAVDEESGAVGLYDLASGAKQQEYAFSSAVAFKQFSADGTQLSVLTESQTLYRIDVSKKAMAQEFHQQ